MSQVTTYSKVVARVSLVVFGLMVFTKPCTSKGTTNILSLLPIVKSQQSSQCSIIGKIWGAQIEQMLNCCNINNKFVVRLRDGLSSLNLTTKVI
jgi:hypothetical protein